MRVQLKRGIVNIAILKRLESRPSYGYEIMADISRFIDMPESTLYTILNRLESKGYLTDFTRQNHGRLRKYYKITRAGIRRLAAFKQECGEMQHLINYILGENDDS
ncbi:MAG: PadR family transcriptional regulator [Candidatus Nomurabacteria bacterium]|jgi:PadR family transcriptional regulator PadR|nr:PadR family transcriptional regulator [Candidatus Nomurabacteria bacterium]